jgi:hypothetical protein
MAERFTVSASEIAREMVWGIKKISRKYKNNEPVRDYLLEKLMRETIYDLWAAFRDVATKPCDN